ncbi:hypothetical protein ACKQTC_08265 [Peptococcus simiae]|uniref:Uncharacterized protein n=1 Tax=Peptococcus simiae TaxID=1643805 RepID=A0ABW9H3C4_9FIRM
MGYRDYLYGFRIDEFGEYGSWRYSSLEEAADYLTGSPEGKCKMIRLQHGDVKDKFVALVAAEPAKKADINLIGSTLLLGTLAGRMIIFAYENDSVRSVSRDENSYLKRIISEVTGKNFR